MNDKRHLYGIAGLLVGAAIILIFTTAADRRKTAGNEADKYFIEQMVPHLDGAIAMAGLADFRAEHDEIKQLAQKIKSTQGSEIQQMNQWYEDWLGQGKGLVSLAYAHGYHVNLGMSGLMGDGSDMGELEVAEPFDKAFIEQMIPHHQMSIMMAQMLQRASQRDEMQDLAHQIIDTQAAEIEQMREWYRAWY